MPLSSRPVLSARPALSAAARLAPLFEQQGNARRWLPMEGLRGFAVALVFVVHFASLIRPDDAAAWLNAAQEVGNVGVDLFFVLSGFLIYKGCIQKPVNFRTYAYRRVERIYPAFLAALIIYLLLMLLMPRISTLPDDGLGAQIGYVMANLLLLPGMLSIDPIMTVAWSLSYEAFYYLPVPLAIAALRMRAWTAPQRLLFILALYAAMVALELSGFGGRFHLSMFLGGMMLHEIVAMRPDERHSASLGADLAAFLAVGAALAFYVLSAKGATAIDTPLSGAFHPVVRLVLVNFAFVLLVYRSVFTAGLASRAYAWTPLRWLGNASYSFYLMHGLGLHAFFTLLGKIWQPETENPILFLALMPPAFLVSLAATLPIYLLVERPLSLGACKSRVASPRPSKAEFQASSEWPGNSRRARSTASGGSPAASATSITNLSS